MLLDTYKANELIWLTTINGKTKNGRNAFRGDLIIKLTENVVVDVDGRQYTLISLPAGMIWNELLDLCFLDKHDLKGQSTEDKVVTVYNSLKTYQPKFKASTLDEAIANRNSVKRQVWGAV